MSADIFHHIPWGQKLSFLHLQGPLTSKRLEKFWLKIVMFQFKWCFRSVNSLCANTQLFMSFVNVVWIEDCLWGRCGGWCVYKFNAPAVGCCFGTVDAVKVLLLVVSDETIKGLAHGFVEVPTPPLFSALLNL